MPRTKTKTTRIRYRPVLKLPPLPPDQYDGLRANIAVNGVLIPILVDGDGPRRKIIDGNYRKQIANELGYECPEIVQAGLEEDEKRTLARALNLARRQLDTDQKRELIADQLAETPGWSLRRVGKMLGVDGKTVASVRAELESTAEFPQFEKTVGLDGKSRPATFVFNGGSPSNPRPSNIATPPGICRFLHDLIAPCYKVKTILDPSAGTGALTKPWKGVKVIAYEIAKGRDFFGCPNRINCDLVICNPPFNATNGETRFLPQVFLERIVKVVPPKTPIVLFTPMAMRLDQTSKSARWRWLRDHAPPITGKPITHCGLIHPVLARASGVKYADSPNATIEKERYIMPNIAAVLKDEIRRLAKKEVKTQVGTTKTAVVQYRRDIAMLKRLLCQQEREIKRLKQQHGQPQVEEEPLDSVRFSARSVKSQRSRLGLSAADYGKLVGVSGLTIYNWEHEKARPRKAQLVSLVSVRGIGKREALKKLAELTPKKGRGRRR
jgi:DNA-binding transcriptional regulator YiaG